MVPSLAFAKDGDDPAPVVTKVTTVHVGELSLAEADEEEAGRDVPLIINTEGGDSTFLHNKVVVEDHETEWYNSPVFWGSVALGVLGTTFVLDQAGVFDQNVRFR